MHLWHRDRISRISSSIAVVSIAVALLTLSFAVHAQQASNPAVVTGQGADESGSFVEKHVFGSIGGDVFIGSPVSRNLMAARVGIDYPFTVAGRSAKLFLEGGFARRSVSLEQKRTNNVQTVWDPNANDGSGGDSSGGFVPRALPETRKLEVTASGAEVREAYLQYDLMDNLSLSAGYQRPIWGQFDIVSPVNLLLPLEFQSDDLSIEKSAYRMPQPAVSAVAFPFERLEVSAYWFPLTNLDPLHEEILDEADGANEVFVANATTFGETESRPRPRKDGSDYDAYAARAVWYGDSFTFGLTYYNGRNTLFAFDELPLVEKVQQEQGDKTYDAYSVIERSLLPGSDTVGVELSVPVGRWTWKGEAFYMGTEADIGGIRRESISQDETDDATLVARRARRGLYDWMVDNNNGRGYVDVNLLMAGAGFDALYDHWRFGAAVFVVDTVLSGKAKEADRLVKAAYPGDDGIGFSGALPNAYIFYDFDEERTTTAGLVGGFAGPFLGVSTFYTSTWFENWRWSASVEYAAAMSDQLMDELNSDSGAYELEDAAALGVRLGLVYEF